MSDKVNAQSNLENKRAQFKENDQKRSPAVMIVVAVVVVALGVAAYFVVTNSSGATGDVVKTTDAVRVSTAALDGGQAQFFDHTLAKGTSVRFFALKSADGKYRAAMDACDTCFHAKKGYRQKGDVMVCNNCGMEFQNNLINEVKGGCNPVGIACVVEGDQLVIKTAELESRGHYFQ